MNRLGSAIIPLLIAVLLGAYPAAAADGGGQRTFELLLVSPSIIALPEPLVFVLGPGRIEAPPVQKVERQLELARSQYRAYVEQEQGLSLAVHVPLEANEKALGAGASLALSHVASDTTAQANVGVGTVYRWDTQQMVAAPRLTLTLKHTLGTTPNDVEDAQQRLRLHEAEVNGQASLRTWTQDVIRAYADASVSQARLHIGQLRQQLAQRQLTAALDKARVGAISDADLHTARQNVWLRQSDVDALALAVDSARVRWAQLAGQASGATDGPDATGFVPVDVNIFHPLTPGGSAMSAYVVLQAAGGPAPAAMDDEQAWVDYALAHHAQVRLAAEKVQVARIRVADASREAGMSAQLEAGITYPDKPNDIPPTLGWRVGAGLNWPLHNKKATEQLLQAELQLEQALADEQALHQGLDAAVRLAFRRQQMATRHLLRMVNDRQHVQELVALAQAAYEAGLGTAVDVMDAEIQLLEAEKAVTEAYYDAAVQRLALWHAVGVDVQW